MLQLLHVTWAPNSVSVSISTAVCTVMCKQPAIRAPASGFCLPYFLRSDMRPGISFSASMISLRPSSARLKSATLNGNLVSTCDTGTSFESCECDLITYQYSLMRDGGPFRAAQESTRVASMIRFGSVG